MATNAQEKMGEAEQRTGSWVVHGRMILLALVLTVPTVFVITWVVLRRMESVMATSGVALVWSERASWPSPPIKRTTLEDVPSGLSGRVPTSKWEEVDFSVPVAVEATVQEAAALARREDFASDEVGAALEGMPKGFYTTYLLGQWHAARGDLAAADALYEQAFREAPAVLKLRYVDRQGAPVVGMELDWGELTLDRVRDVNPDPDVFVGEIDQTFKLAYPHLVTDEMGAIYLPAFHTIYRWTHLPQPTAVDLTVQYRQVEGWFEFPGSIGSPAPAVVVER